VGSVQTPNGKEEEKEEEKEIKIGIHKSFAFFLIQLQIGLI
jgi:hypothetical protein